MLREQINQDFMTAFKAKDMNKKNFLGVIKGEIQNAELRGISPTDENVIAILKKMEKSLLQTNTADALKELEYIAPYLPVMMSESLCREKVAMMIGSGVTTMSQIMAEFNKHYKGLVDNKMLSEVVKAALN
jgi:uncharacterized protein YqeY